MRYHRQSNTASRRWPAWPSACLTVELAAIVLGLLVPAWLFPETAAVRGQDLPGLQTISPPDDAEVRTTDLIRLADTYADALAEMKIAQVRIDTLCSLRQSVVVTDLEIQVARIRLQMSQRKTGILRTIVESELATAIAKLASLRETQVATQRLRPDQDELQWPEIIRAESAIRVLRMILEMS